MLCCRTKARVDLTSPIKRGQLNRRTWGCAAIQLHPVHRGPHELQQLDCAPRSPNTVQSAGPRLPRTTIEAMSHVEGAICPPGEPQKPSLFSRNGKLVPATASDIHKTVSSRRSLINVSDATRRGSGAHAATGLGAWYAHRCWRRCSWQLHRHRRNRHMP